MVQRCGVASPAPHGSFTPTFRILQPLSHSTTPPLPHNPALSNLHPHPNPHALNPGMARAPNVLNTVMQVSSPPQGARASYRPQSHDG